MASEEKEMSDRAKNKVPVDVTTGDHQYDYVDKTLPPMEERVMPGQGGTEATSAELNPAFYPKDSKPEAMHNEAEKKGAEFPGGTHLQAAMAPADMDSKEGKKYDPTDPETANPPAPGAESSTGGNPPENQSSGVKAPPKAPKPEDTKPEDTKK